MAKSKEIKNWTLKVSNERITLAMTVKGVDGRYHSASAPYPCYEESWNEDGTKNIRRMTRKQVEKMLLSQLGYVA